MATASVPRPTSLLMLLVVYLGTFIGGVSLFYILAYVVEAYFDTPFPDNNSMGIILMVVSAVITGTFWYNREKADPSSARKWKLALLLTIATVGSRPIDFGPLA